VSLCSAWLDNSGFQRPSAILLRFTCHVEQASVLEASVLEIGDFQWDLGVISALA
jgi:hypothetical protein